MEKFCKTWQLSPIESSDAEASRDFYRALGLNLFMRCLMKKGKIIARFKESIKHPGKFYLIMTSELQAQNDMLRYTLGPFKPKMECDDESYKDHVVELNKFTSYFKLVEQSQVLKQYIIPTNKNQQVIALVTRFIDEDGNLRQQMECNGMRVHKMFRPVQNQDDANSDDDL